LRGSAGFAPASLSSPCGEDARSEESDKERKQLNESKGGDGGKSNRANAGRHTVSIQGLEKFLANSAALLRRLCDKKLFIAEKHQGCAEFAENDKTDAPRMLQNLATYLRNLPMM
jgi:hypothetical protein